MHSVLSSCIAVGRFPGARSSFVRIDHDPWVHATPFLEEIPFAAVESNSGSRPFIQEQLFSHAYRLIEVFRPRLLSTWFSLPIERFSEMWLQLRGATIELGSLNSLELATKDHIN